MSIEVLLGMLEAQPLDTRVALAMRCNPGMRVALHTGDRRYMSKLYRGSIGVHRAKRIAWKKYGLMFRACRSSECKHLHYLGYEGEPYCITLDPSQPYEV